MKEFNWETFRGSEQRKIWLFKNHKKSITEDEFIKAMVSLKQYSSIKKCPSKKYSPSSLRKEFKQFRKEYGFFPVKNSHLLDV